MKALAAIFLACWLAGVAGAESPAVALVPDQEGYLPLFNGRDLAGWKVWKNQADFQIQGGIVRCQRGGDGQFMLYMGQEFADFELVVEWRVSPKGNSGVFIRSPFREWPWDTGYEVQISNEQPPRDETHCSGSLYGYAGVSPRPDETPERWRTYRIRAVGNRITVAVDGTQVVDFDQSTTDKTRAKQTSGFIGVQDSHSGDEGTWVEYRTIKVKPL
jgi:hypothetical protein